MNQAVNLATMHKGTDHWGLISQGDVTLSIVSMQWPLFGMSDLKRDGFTRHLWIVAILQFILIPALLLVFRPPTSHKKVESFGFSLVLRTFLCCWLLATLMSTTLYLVLAILGGSNHLSLAHYFVTAILGSTITALWVCFLGWFRFLRQVLSEPI